MKSCGLSRLLLLVFLVSGQRVHGHCFLDKPTAAKCLDLEDVRYTNTYNLHALRAPSSSKTLTPGNFQNLTSIRHLDLSGGKLQRIESDSFTKLGSLQTLNLADNDISYLNAGAFDGLEHLHSLKLGNNKIKQLPSALMNLKELRLLDISDNPLNCNCASLKLRDVLLARGVKISKKSLCSEPPSLKQASILKPDTKATCIFESQDLDMQGDQPIDDNEGSGEIGDNEYTEESEKEIEDEEKELEKLADNENEEVTSAPSTSSEPSSSSIETTPSIVEATSSTTEAKPSATEMTFSTTENASIAGVAPEGISSTTASDDDVTTAETERSAKIGISTAASADLNDDLTESTESDEMDDYIEPTDEQIKQATTDDHSSTTATSKSDASVLEEGSGEGDDDGSGLEGSGLIPRLPAAIDFNETGSAYEEEESQFSSTSSTTTTTESNSWWGFGDILHNLNPWGSSETTESPRTTEKSAEDDLKEEQFIKVTSEAPIINKVEDAAKEAAEAPKIVSLNEDSRHSPRTVADSGIESNSVDTAFSQESRKGMGSYVVLAILLAVLAILIGFAAYKGDFCRKKRKRADVEKGTELKDMQRSLLDQNQAQPKIQVANGNTLENVPLMSSAPPEEPKENQKSYDVTPAVVTNGSSNAPSLDVNDPVKPPRKSLTQEIEAPLNGLNPPMDDIDGPTTPSYDNIPNEVLNGGYVEKPPVSPNAQRVKITLQDNPDSVPKTPILITRLKNGENLVKTRE